MNYERFKSAYFWFFALGSFSGAAKALDAPSYVSGILSGISIMLFVVATTLLISGYESPEKGEEA